MIVPITGKVTYSITMDPTVWIFDDRKIILEDAFIKKDTPQEQDELEKAAERFNQEIYQQKIKPPVNKSISRFERENILKHSYVMPIEDFLGHAEPDSDAQKAVLKTSQGEVEIPLQDLQASYLLFAIDGKPVTDEGPVQLYYRDGTNKENPIKGISKIEII
ncbi:hypothetical protein DX933_05295 [Ornithinibacillus gellani]|uniref:hypothetical protein n=1 Tax=Ornithinibacillus gellani TaxID=2293253 RepID=UPI000F490578|nr:hypothetical protein [Ornithinibacillus gellani]TQS75690.1 hypothetical protein DX933_05295 [Ornithinibacillus gellani]